MKRNHEITLNGVDLTLALDFKTSLLLKEKVASPTFMVEELMREYAMNQDGKPYTKGFDWDEEIAATVLAIGNKPYQNMGVYAIGELIMEHGALNSYGLVISYLQAMVLGRSKEAEVSEDGEESGN